jgi:hypothetical protein
MVFVAENICDPSITDNEYMKLLTYNTVQEQQQSYCTVLIHFLAAAFLSCD